MGNKSSRSSSKSTGRRCVFCGTTGSRKQPFVKCMRCDGVPPGVQAASGPPARPPVLKTVHLGLVLPSNGDSGSEASAEEDDEKDLQAELRSYFDRSKAQIRRGLFFKCPAGPSSRPESPAVPRPPRVLSVDEEPTLDPPDEKASEAPVTPGGSEKPQGSLVLEPNRPENSSPQPAKPRLGGREYKILHCHPPAGVVGPKTKLLLTESSGSLRRLHGMARVIRRLDLKPTRASLTPDKRSLKDALSSASLLPEIKRHFTDPNSFSKKGPPGRKMQRIHLATGELFTTSQGTEFRVMSAEPRDGVVDLKETTIACSGRPLEDVKSVTLLPIYETIPNREKDYTAEQILNTYIIPYTAGLSVHVARLGELSLNGVDFAVTDCDPQAGILTCDTRITNTQANIRAGAWRNKKMEEDEALARRLQGESSIPILRGSLPHLLARAAEQHRQQQMGQNGGGRGRNSRRRGNQAPLVIGQQAGPNGQQSLPPAAADMMLQQLVAILNGGRIPGGRGAGPVSNKANAAHLASMLPTRVYSSNRESIKKKARMTELAAELRNGPSPIPADADGPDPAIESPELTLDEASPAAPVSNDELKLPDSDEAKPKPSAKAQAILDEEEAALPKCRICLEFYEDGEEVKTLPCFHIFHSNCIDKWLGFSDDCPICKTSVSAAFNDDFS